MLESAGFVATEAEMILMTQVASNRAMPIFLVDPEGTLTRTIQ